MHVEPYRDCLRHKGQVPRDEHVPGNKKSFVINTQAIEASARRAAHDDDPAYDGC